MLIANQYSNEVAVLPLIDGETGFGPVAARAAVPGASCVQFVEFRRANDLTAVNVHCVR
jgi:hypothetical protein